jgi:hypothetical protein
LGKLEDVIMAKRIEVTFDGSEEFSSAIKKALQALFNIGYQEASNMASNSKFKRM